MKKFLAILTLVLCCISMVSCDDAIEAIQNLGHQHEWENATCETPKTCLTCGETEGAASGHRWKDATCEKPKTCENCHKEHGTSLGHNVRIGTCSRCGNKSYELKSQADKVLIHFNDFIIATTNATENISLSYKFYGDEFQRSYVQDAYNEYYIYGIAALGNALEICGNYTEFKDAGDKIAEILTVINSNLTAVTDNSYSTIREVISDTIDATAPLMVEMMDITSEWQ